MNQERNLKPYRYTSTGFSTAKSLNCKCNSQASITANHVSVVVKEVTDASRHRVIFPFGFGGGLGLLSAPVVVTVTAHRHSARFVVDQRCHRAYTSLFYAAQVCLNAWRQHTRPQRLTRRYVRRRRICDNLGEAGWWFENLWRGSRERGKAEILKTIFEIFERRYVMRLLLLLLSSRVLFKNVTEYRRRRRWRWSDRQLCRVIVILQRPLKRKNLNWPKRIDLVFHVQLLE